MSEDIKKDQETEPINENDILANIDQILVHEDPEFMKALSEITIDNSAVNISDSDKILEAHGQYSTASYSSLSGRIKQIIDFRHNFKSVMGFWISVSLVFAALYFGLQSRFWDKKTRLFLTSYAEWGAPVQDYNPLNEVQLFFDNPKLSKNLLEMKKMKANLKVSSNSSDNPMLAFEIRVEGLSKEVIVELKDRESEFVDLILRTTEEFSYDELTETSGKQKLSEKIINVLNQNLTQGQVRKVMYSSFILKN